MFGKARLKQQFERLSEREKQIIYCLAVCHHPLSMEKIQQYIQPKIYSSDLIQALYSLRKRSLIERSSELDFSVFTLPLMVKKYIIRDCQQDRDRLKQSLKNL